MLSDVKEESTCKEVNPASSPEPFQTIYNPIAKSPVSTGESNHDILDENPESTPLRPLTSLKWPYAPEESAFPDPLKRDDPKSLQLAQYEAIGKSLSSLLLPTSVLLEQFRDNNQ